MKHEVRTVDNGWLQITGEDERFYARSISTEGTEENRRMEYVPSVTWIAGQYPKDERFTSWVGRVGNEAAREAKEAGGEKGSKTHQAISALLKGGTINFQTSTFENRDGQPEDLNAKEVGCVWWFVQWFKATRPEVIAFDFTVWSDKYRYAGTVDLYCRINGIPWIVDFKVSPNVYPSYEIQVSAYKFADVRFPKNTRLAILQLGYEKNRVQKYKFTRVKDQFTLFMAAYRIWKKEHGDTKPYQREYPVEISLSPEFDTEGCDKCMGCGAEIRWEKTSANKWTPVNLDGTPHWGTCPKAKDFKKSKARATAL